MSHGRRLEVRPLRQPLEGPRTPDPLVMVIFGATGDLTRRKLIPALFRLFREGLLPPAFAVVGLGREEHTDEEFRARMRAAVEEFSGEPPAEKWRRFSAALSYVGTAFDDEAGYARLAARLESLEAEPGAGGNRLFYLAIPPSVIGMVVERLGRAGLVHEPGAERWSRVIVEKPFGRDLESARELNLLLFRVFDEEQVYRIDHYLGKETVQNLLVFRFANVIWEPLWSRQYVDHVQITVAESVGVESRAGYYDRAGALRDMVQSHLLQLFTLVAMEPPASYDAESIRTEKVKVLCSTRPIRPEAVGTETVRARYGAGTVQGEPVRGYLEEQGVPASSETETFVALRLLVDNWRWAGVPFYLRTGKRLATRASEIAIQFRHAPHPLLDVVEGDRPAPNLLRLRIQPREGISLRFEAKVPGLHGPLHPVTMDFDYGSSFEDASPEAYERLLLDAMLGDATLFARRDEVEAAWSLVTPVLEGWARPGAPPVESYAAGSWGPAAASRLLQPAGRAWWEPEP